MRRAVAVLSYERRESRHHSVASVPWNDGSRARLTRDDPEKHYVTIAAKGVRFMTGNRHLSTMFDHVSPAASHDLSISIRINPIRHPIARLRLRLRLVSPIGTGCENSDMDPSPHRHEAAPETHRPVRGIGSCIERNLPYTQAESRVSRKGLQPEEKPAKMELVFRDSGSGLPFRAPFPAISRRSCRRVDDPSGFEGY